MRRQQLLLLALCLLAASGFIQRSTGGFRPADIQEMVILPPIGLVSVLGQGNQATFDPNASIDAGELLHQALFRHDEKLHLRGELILKDSILRRTVPRLSFQFIQVLEHQHKKSLAVPLPWLDSLLAARKQRHVLVSCVWGYTRTPGNYRAQVAKDLGIGLLSMGMIIPLSSKSSTRVGVFIYDAQKHAIVYYKSNWPTDKDPLEGVVIDRELTDMLAKDFNLTDRI